MCGGETNGCDQPVGHAIPHAYPLARLAAGNKKPRVAGLGLGADQLP